MLETIKKFSSEYYNQIVALRRYLHRNPELSFNEFKTSKRIAEELISIGIPIYQGIGETGIIGIIEGGKPGQTIGFRAELDALPINEETEHEFSSVSPNIMHACGHDVHMASLLGVARVLWHIRAELKGKVLLVFQPGEELLPGGALKVIESEVFKSNKPDVMLGLHILPELQAGMVGFRPGIYMASGDEIYLTVKGKGGHAALPHTVIDPVLIASHIIVGLQQIASRKGPSDIPTVLSFGKISSNGANNVIPDEVQIEGTFRTMDEDWRAKAHQEIVRIATGIASSMGGECVVEIRNGYPSLSNNPRLTGFASDRAKEYYGESAVVELPIRMTTDDFAHYSKEIPSVYFRVGSGFPDKGVMNLHSGKLEINEHVLEHSSGFSAWLIYSILNK